MLSDDLTADEVTAEICSTCDSEELSCKTCSSEAGYLAVDGKCCPADDANEKILCRFFEEDGV